VESLFLEGPPGSGKRARLLAHIARLIADGVPPYSLFILLPDRPARERLRRDLPSAVRGYHGALELHTYYSLAQRMSNIFWPLIARPAGFAHSSRPPTHLTYETAQYLMHRIVEPLLDQGYFEGLAIRRQRLISQLLDNLNKAAINGYPHTEIGQRLITAWTGEDERHRAYAQAQTCADLFRRYCLEHNLLDISLTVEVFHRYLVEDPVFWNYFAGRYRHLVVANVEETVPVAQDLIRRLLPALDSVFLTYETGGGYRVFLGVDPVGGWQLADLCDRREALPTPADTNPDLVAFALAVGQRLGQVPKGPLPGDPTAAVTADQIIQARYRSEMIAHVADEIGRLVTEEDVSPGEIAVVAPYADGVLRFVLRESFQEAGVPFRILRRFESLREDPIARACLTVAVLAHPTWEVPCPAEDVAEALSLVIEGMDYVRATRLVKELFREEERALASIENLPSPIADKVGTPLLERYETLRRWLADYREGEPLAVDHFIQRFFGDVLGQPGFRAATDLSYAHSVSRLVESARRFRQVAPELGVTDTPAGAAYWRMVYDGVVAAQYLVEESFGPAEDVAVTLVAPIYTFLLSGRRVRYQFWLDVGSISWWEPPYQPLTNPYVLSRNWATGQRWTDERDYHVRNEVLYRMVHGLCERCTEAIYLCTSELETSGELQDSPLMRAVLKVVDVSARRDAASVPQALVPG
jgi:hypothetical protein